MKLMESIEIMEPNKLTRMIECHNYLIRLIINYA